MTDTDNTNHKDKINKSNLFQDDTTNGEFILTDDLFIKVKDEIRDDIDLEIDNSLLQQILLENGLLGKIDKETLKRILIERGDAIKKRSLKERDEKIANDNKAIIKASIFNRLNLFEEKKRALGNANKNVIKLNIENKKIGSQTPEEKESKNVDEKVEENIDSTNKNISISKMKDLSTLKAPGNIGLNTKNRADGSILWQGSIEWGEMLITGVITKMGSEINISISFSNSSKKNAIFKQTGENTYTLDNEKMDDNIVILKDDEIIYTNDRGVAYSFNQTDKSATITKNDNTIELPVSDRNGHLVVDANSNSISRRLTAMILLTQAYKDVSKFAEVEDERQI